MKRSILGCAVAASLLGAGHVAAGGLWLNEYGDFAGGRAGAGAAAGVDEAATLFYNPASMTRLEGSQLFLSGGAFIPEVKFDIEYTSPRNGHDNGGQAGQVAPAVSAAYIHDLDSDKWSVGVTLGGLSGAGLEYNDNWVGRYEATEVELVLLGVAPTVAYQVTDRLSIGASLQYWYSSLDLKLRVPNPLPNRDDGRASIDGDDDGFAFTLGAMYEISDRTRLGIFYQDELQPKYDGDLKIKPVGLDVSSDTELSLGAYLRFAIHHDLDDQWGVDFSVGWDNWSALDNVFISTEDRAAGLATNWHDTYHYAWGLQYQLNDKWAFTSGIAYDTNPVDADDRAADLPIDRQIRYAVGTRYQFRDNLTLGGYVNYADLGKARIYTDNWGGDYQDNNLLQLVVNANWTF